MRFEIGNGEFHVGDCFDVMRDLPDGSVDMILCDLLYGTTQNQWDVVIPFEPLWENYWRVMKPNGSIVLTADQPFTSALIMSQHRKFRYSWHWHKVQATGFLNAKKMALKAVEDIYVFYSELPTYNPIMRESVERKRTPSKNPSSGNYRDGLHQAGKYSEQSSGNERYPTTHLEISEGL